jgi:hypothetical protein
VGIVCPPLVEIGLTDLTKSGGTRAPPSPSAYNRPVMHSEYLHFTYSQAFIKRSEDVKSNVSCSTLPKKLTKKLALFCPEGGSNEKNKGIMLNM